MAANNSTRDTVLSTLAGSGNQLVQLGTLALVAISGLTSFFQTQQVGEQGHRDRDKAIKEIHELYNQVEAFEKRQNLTLQNGQAIMDSNNKQLNNQTEMLENQQNVLRIMRDNQQRYLRNSQPGP